MDTEMMIALIIVFLIAGRVSAEAMFNRTLREAMKTSPDTLPLLLDDRASCRTRRTFRLGWIFLTFGAALLATSMFEEGAERSSTIEISVAAFVVGASILLYQYVLKLKEQRKPEAREHE